MYRSVRVVATLCITFGMTLVFHFNPYFDKLTNPTKREPNANKSTEIN